MGTLVVLHDITHLRRLETARRDFVKNVSHELKTPITSIKGFVETLLAGALKEPEVRKDFSASFTSKPTVSMRSLTTC